MIVSPPEQGQLVSCRQRRYVVTEVAKSTLPERPLRVGGNGSQHLVTLSSVEDDALGEELQVIWELEPGAQVIEKIALPMGELEGDLEFLMRAVRKMEAIREDLGKVGPVIAEQVHEAMLGTCASSQPMKRSIVIPTCGMRSLRRSKMPVWSD